MITLSGCARLNADRELARILDLLDGHILMYQRSLDVAVSPDLIAHYTAGKRSLEALRTELARKAHRDRP